MMGITVLGELGTVKMASLMRSLEEPDPFRSTKL
jgi:hypothetical protein